MEQMELRELMVGDWVRVAGKPAQVIETRLGALYGDKYVTAPIRVYCNFRFFDVMNGADPIPLTEDILKASGWKHSTCSFWRNENVWTMLVLNGKKKMDELRVHFGDGVYLFACNSTWFDVYFRHVHELQHLLRLCRHSQVADSITVEE